MTRVSGSGTGTAPPPRHAPAAEAEHRQEAAAWPWLVLLTGIAVVLRAIGLNGGLWQDEIYAVAETIRPPLLRIIGTYPADTHHPLYAVLAHIAVSLLGEAPWTARLPALLFGAATVPALYLLGRHIGTRTEALLACAVLTVSFHHVWFSQNARGYTALAFFAVLCAYCLLRGIRTSEARWFGLYALFIGLGAYANLTLIFMAVAQAVPCAWLAWGPRAHRRIGDWRLPVVAFGGGALVTVLLYLPMLGEVIGWFLHRPSNLVGASTPSWALVEAVRVLALGMGVHPLALLAAGLVFVAGLYSYWRQDPAIVWLFMLPAVATLTGAVAARGTLYPRFFFYLAGPLLLIAVRGALTVGGWLGAALPRRVAWRTQAPGWMIVALMIVASARSLGYNYAYPKQDFEGAIAFVDAERGADEPVVIAGPDYPYRYYDRVWPRVESVADLEAVRRDAAGVVWVLFMQPRYIELSAPGLVAAIERDCAERRKFDGTVGGGDIVVCRLAPVAGSAARTTTPVSRRAGA